MTHGARKELFDFDYKYGQMQTVVNKREEDPFLYIPTRNDQTLDKPGDLFRLLDKSNDIDLARPNAFTSIRTKLISKLIWKFWH